MSDGSWPRKDCEANRSFPACRQAGLPGVLSIVARPMIKGKALKSIFIELQFIQDVRS